MALTDRCYGCRPTDLETRRSPLGSPFMGQTFVGGCFGIACSMHGRPELPKSVRFFLIRGPGRMTLGSIAHRTSWDFVDMGKWNLLTGCWSVLVGMMRFQALGASRWLVLVKRGGSSWTVGLSEISLAHTPSRNGGWEYTQITSSPKLALPGDCHGGASMQ